jgi:hypothetical protein
MGKAIGKIGGKIGQTFGKVNPNATKDVLNGESVATGTEGAKTIADAQGGLSDGQLRNRKLLKMVGGGLSGIDQQQAPRGAGNQLDLPAPAPMVDVGQQGNYLDGYLKRKRSPFFGESY